MTQKRLHEVIAYYPDTGKLYWNETDGNPYKGLEAGSNGNGYIYIQVDGIKYLVHRLAWLHYYGYFPEKNLDHIDRDKSNNRILNLREESQQCNLRNTGNPKGNKSGVKGVFFEESNRLWRVTIGFNGKMHHIGRFDDFTEAVCYRLAVEQCLNWSGCDSSSPAYEYIKKIV